MRAFVSSLGIALLAVAACGGGASGRRARTHSATGAETVYQLPLRCGARGPEYVVPLPVNVAPPTGPVSLSPNRPKDAEARANALGQMWARYSEADKQLMLSGWIRAGLDELGVYVARGRPELHFGTSFDGKTCHALLYGVRPETTGVDLIVYTCDGIVQRADDVQPPLACDRVAAVAPRFVERAPQIATMTPDRQWLVLRGQIQRDMTPAELELAFGPPQRRGEESRPDGTRAVQLMWDAVDGKPLLVTVVNDRVASWSVPAAPAAQAAQKSLVVGGCTYIDALAGALGAPCQPSAPCIAGYICKGAPGVCVPAAQDAACPRR